MEGYWGETSAQKCLRRDILCLGVSLPKEVSAALPIFLFDGLMLGVYICRVCFKMKHFRSYILYREDWTSKLWKTKNCVPDFQPNAFHDLFTASLCRLVEQEWLNPLRSPPHFCIFFIGNTCSVLSVFIIIRQCLYCRCCWFF